MTREEMLALLERRLSSWHDRNPEALAADCMETAVLASPMIGQREPASRSSFDA